MKICDDGGMHRVCVETALWSDLKGGMEEGQVDIHERFAFYIEDGKGVESVNNVVRVLDAKSVKPFEFVSYGGGMFDCGLTVASMSEESMVKVIEAVNEVGCRVVAAKTKQLLNKTS